MIAEKTKQNKELTRSTLPHHQGQPVCRVWGWGEAQQKIFILLYVYTSNRLNLWIFFPVIELHD